MRETPSYRAYLFDLDGVLVDNLAWISGAYRHTAARHGFEAADEQLSTLFGRPLAECYSTLCPDGDLQTLIRCHREFQAAHPELQGLFDGAAELLDRLRARGALTGLISARSGASLLHTLDRFNLMSRFDVVVLPEACERHKPHPEPVERALATLGTAATHALVIGDTPNDIDAGRAAGTETAGATYGFLGPAVLAARPTHRVDRVTEIAELWPLRAMEPAR